MLSQTGARGRKLGASNAYKFNKENENLETEPQFRNCFGSQSRDKEREIDQLTHRYHTYLQ